MDFRELVVSYGMQNRKSPIITYPCMCIGRHCCLWCLITQADLKIPLEQRGRFPTRSVESLRNDYKSFTESGGDLKHAKLFNNSIGEPIFNLPLEKVQ